MNPERLNWLVLLVAVCAALLLIALRVARPEIEQPDALRHLEWVLPLVVRLAFLD